ncbi:MAG: aldo/keto reductase [Lachnospiraceae bacterium]
MNKIKLGNILEVPQVALGMMRIKNMSKIEVEALVDTAMELGINFFEHADIYGGNHHCEEVFRQVVTPSLREKILIQTKCGITNGMLDFSKEHIVSSVDQSLKSLGVEYLDVLALHRPDALVEPEVVAEAFDELEAQGKVRHFGVSNHTAMQIALLQKYVKQPLIVNQMQMSIMHTPMIDAGLHANMMVDDAINRDGAVLDYCRLHDINIQAWSPFQYGFFSGVFIDHDEFPELNKVMQVIADRYGVTKTAVAVAFLNRHPAKIQTIVGTTNLERLHQIASSTDFKLSRAEWYDLYKAAGNTIP